jgi:hypothetical protein
MADANPPVADAGLITTPNDILLQWSRHEALAARLLPLNKTRLLAALAAAGIATVIIRFDGCGDSGQIEEVEALDADDVGLEIPAVPVELMEQPWNTEVAVAARMSLGAALEAHAYHLLGATHPGWENNDGAYGEFTFDVAAGMIRLEHAVRYVATERYSHEF